MTYNAVNLHPDHEILELFLLGRLDPDLVDPIEEHILVCHGCQDACICLEQETDLLRVALRYCTEQAAFIYSASA